MGRLTKMIIGGLVIVAWYYATQNENPMIDPELRDSLMSKIDLAALKDVATRNFVWRLVPAPLLIPFIFYQYSRWRKEGKK